MELDRAIRIINYDANENVSESEQLEAFKVFLIQIYKIAMVNIEACMIYFQKQAKNTIKKRLR